MVNKIGFHARSTEEFLRVIRIEGVDLVELKPQKFHEKNDASIYYFDGEHFEVNEDLVKKIARLCDGKGITVQIHLPYEKTCDPSIEGGLCQAVRRHHGLILARYAMFGEMLRKFGIGSVLTTHPPAFQFDGVPFCSEEDALEIGAELYFKLDRLIKHQGYGFQVGIENVVAPKSSGASSVGYTPKHIDQLIGNTSRIGITVDTGHRRLNDEMSIAKLFSYGQVVSLHFHSNPGEVSDENYDDDEHVFATPENLPHYDRYMKGLRRRGLPIVLEIDKLDETTDDELGAYVRNLRSELGD